MFDDDRWYQASPNHPGETITEFCDAMQDAGVTDLLVTVCGHYQGGTMGWGSGTYIDVYDHEFEPIPATHLTTLINLCTPRGINVHGVVNTATANWTLTAYSVIHANSILVDVNDAGWQAWITNIYTELAGVEGLAGINLDFIRGEPYESDGGTPISEAAGATHDVTMAALVADIYNGCKAVNPNLIISSWTTPFNDTDHPVLDLAGRKAINWFNSGHQDIIFDGNYGSYYHKTIGLIGATGDPPHMELAYSARKLMGHPDSLVVMAATYEDDNDPTTLGAGKFNAILNTLAAERDVAFYTSWLFTDELGALLKESRFPVLTAGVSTNWGAWGHGIRGMSQKEKSRMYNKIKRSTGRRG